MRREQEAEAQRQRAVRRKLVLIGVVLLCLVLAFAGLALWALAERSTAQQRADEAESQALAARSLRAQSLAPRLSLALATRAEERSATPQAEEALRRTLVAWPKPTVLVAPGRKTYGVDFSPDGRLVATAGGDGAFVRSTTGRLVATLITGKLVYSARFSSDSRFLVTAGADGAVRLWRVRGWRELPSRARASFPRLLARAAFSADDRFLVVGGHPGWPNRVWRFREGRVGPRLTRPGDPRGWIEPDGTARVVDAGTAAWTAGVTESAPFAFASSAGARRLAVSDYDATRVFRVETRRLLRTLPTAVGAVFGPGGGRLATEGRPTVIWDVSRQRPEAVLAGRFGGAAFSRDGTLLVGASANARSHASGTRGQAPSSRSCRRGRPGSTPRWFCPTRIPTRGTVQRRRERQQWSRLRGPRPGLRAQARRGLLARRRPGRDLGPDERRSAALAAVRHASPRGRQHDLARVHPRLRRLPAAATRRRQRRRSARRRRRRAQRGRGLERTRGAAGRHPPRQHRAHLLARVRRRR